MRIFLKSLQIILHMLKNNHIYSLFLFIYTATISNILCCQGGMKIVFFLYPTPFNSDNTTLEDVDENTYIVPSHKNTQQRRLMTLRLAFRFLSGGYQIATIRRTRIDHMIQNHGLISGQQRSLLHLLCRFHQLREQNNWDFWWRLLQEHPLVPNHKVLECIIWRILHSIYYEMKIEDDSTVYVRAICTSEPSTFLIHQGDCGFFPFVHFLVNPSHLPPQPPG